MAVMNKSKYHGKKRHSWKMRPAVKMQTIEECLSILENLSEQNIDVINSQYWQKIDNRYHNLMMNAEIAGREVKMHQKRYDALVDKLDKRTEELKLSARDYHDVNKHGIRITGEDYEGEFRTSVSLSQKRGARYKMKFRR